MTVTAAGHTCSSRIISWKLLPAMSAVASAHSVPTPVLQSGRLELFSLEGLAAHADADAEASGSLGTLEVPDDQVCWCLLLQLWQLSTGNTCHAGQATARPLTGNCCNQTRCSVASIEIARPISLQHMWRCTVVGVLHRNIRAGAVPAAGLQQWHCAGGCAGECQR